MIPETSVNWKAFEYKFSDNPQRACHVLKIWICIMKKDIRK